MATSKANSPETNNPQASGEAPGAAAAAELDQELKRLEQLNEQLNAELEDAKQRALRFGAELENYRKRADRQAADERKYANLPLLRDLLPVLDNVYRAIDAAEKSSRSDGLLAGVRLVAQQLEGVLQRYHCVPIEALHQPFDPHLHQAVGQQPTDQYPPNTVVVVTQPGYRLHDRVVRPSLVIVSAEPAPSEQPQPDGQTAQE